MDSRAKYLLAALAALGYLGGWLHTILEVAESCATPPAALAAGSFGAALLCALLCGAAAGGVALSADGRARLKALTPAGEVACALLFFGVGSAGLRATLWAMGG